MIPLEILLLYRTVLAILNFLLFHMKLSIVLSRSVKNCVGTLMVIVINLLIAFDWMTIVPIHVHGRSLHL